jgi:CheY-like chemotaxis protein
MGNTSSRYFYARELALTKELVERHYGKISVSSAEGHGTRFTVTLPLGNAHFKPGEIVVDASDAKTRDEKRKPYVEFIPTGTKPQAGTAQQSTGDQDIILVVDDHPEMRQFIRQYMEPVYKVHEAGDGREGVDAAIEIIPDLVISDVMMPRLDGYQLCEALKTDEKTSHIPVVLLTAKAGEESKFTGLETGADDYLIKPFNFRELQMRVHNLIDQRRKLRERYRREGLLLPREITVPSVEEAFLQKLMGILETHLVDEDFGVEKLGDALHLGQRQLHRKIRGLTGQAPVEFIRTVRLQRARQLLEQNAGTISEIAFQSGFNNLSYFAKCFKEEFGRLPSEFAGKK